MQPGAPPLAPPEVERLLEAGVGARLAGRPEEARADFARISAEENANSDYWLNYGLADYAAGSLDAAEAALRRCLALAPAYDDAQIALARVLIAKGDRAGALAQVAAVRARNPENAEARGVEQDLRSGAPLNYRFDALAGYSRLSAGAPWREYDLAIGGRVTATTGLAASLETSNRFSETDTYLGGRIDQSIGRWGAYVGAGGAPDAHFRALWAVQAGGETPPLWSRGGVSVGLGLDSSFSEYPSEHVQTAAPYVVLRAPYGIEVAGQFVATRTSSDQTLLGYILKAQGEVTPKLLLNLAYADAPESDTGRASPVKAASAGAEIRLTRSYALKLIGVHEVHPSFTRDELDLALTRRF